MFLFRPINPLETNERQCKHSWFQEQILMLLAENEELKEKLNAVLITNWNLGGKGGSVDGLAGGKGEPLILTTQVPDYLKRSVMVFWMPMESVGRHQPSKPSNSIKQSSG